MSAAAELRPLPALAVECVPQPAASLDPEFDLLVACCAATWDPAASGRIRQLLCSPLDWKKLLGLAEHHGLVPLLFQSAAGLSRLIPPPHFAALRLRCQQNACRALWFTQELNRILARMQSAGVDVLAHKGPALASLLYGDVAQRQFNDLDLLVRPRQVSQAKAILADLGYQCDIEFRAAQQRALLRSGYEQVFHSSHGKNLLELQWRILPRFYAVDFDSEKLFARSKEVQLADRSCRMLAPEDLLLVLCVHASKHGWTQLSWLRDITQLAGMPGLDWEYIADEAERMGIQRIVAINFALCSRLFGTTVPDDHHDSCTPYGCHPDQAVGLAFANPRARGEPALSDPEEEATRGSRTGSCYSSACDSNGEPAVTSAAFSTPDPWACDARTSTLADEVLTALRSGVSREPESLAYFRWTMRLRERRRDRARFLWRLSSTPSISEWKTVKLPAPLFPLYRLVRVFRLAGRFFCAGAGVLTYPPARPTSPTSA